MNRRNLVLGIGAVSVAGFGLAGFAYNRTSTKPQAAAPSAESTTLVRPHSPVLGPANAKVTIVEFFDPGCETCRAMYPIVKKIMAEYPNDVRLVFRYAAFHKGSDEVVRIIEMARKQNKFTAVTEALLAAQPEWADHHQPNVAKAWEAAAAAGLDIGLARKGMMAPEITAVLTQDAADIRAVGVRQTPTFFVNGKPLPSFGVRQLQELVRSEVEAARK
jgi:protein-disulfide isomerase